MQAAFQAARQVFFHLNSERMTAAPKAARTRINTKPPAEAEPRIQAA
ncbi:hypothetical protein [Kingella denitrificans]